MPDSAPTEDALLRRPAYLNFPTAMNPQELTHVQAIIASDVDDDDLRSLAELQHLTELRISGQFTDAGLIHLRKLQRLEQLSLASPKLRGDGVHHLAALSQLRSLRFEHAQLTAWAARVCSKACRHLTSLKLEGPTVGVDHVLMLTPMRDLESLHVVGNGDILGGTQALIDRASAAALARRCPALQRVSVRWWNGSSMVGDAALIAMLEAHPGLTVNDTWYDPEVFEPGAAGSPGRTDFRPSGAVVDLGAGDFDAAIDAAPVMIVQTWSSNPSLCKAFGVRTGSMLTSLEQLAPLLAARALVGRVDEHLHAALADKLHTRYGIQLGSLVVFRHGELVGRIGGTSAASIRAQLTPILGRES